MARFWKSENRKSRSWRLTAALLLTGLLAAYTAGCGPESAKEGGADGEPAKQQTELLVSAAASLTDALNELKNVYERSHPAVKLTFNFGASGALQQQIEQGAPADLFLSAAVKNMKTLLDKQLIDENEQQAILRNELVVVVPNDDKGEWRAAADLAASKVKRIAIGIPESVPAGSYAKEALTAAKLWEVLEPKLVQAKDVRQVLSYVETGNADAGFVYKTDAMSSQKVKVAFTVDPSTYTPALYPAGVVKTTRHPELSRELFRFLQTKEAADIFSKYGFSPAAPGT
ncbi:molybdate ABC transporter substrate-binding protein [Paenibacillus sp. GYB004]|uniref:molybdate ABC transporter substrate-binding protein n=1 Tax=Paenibacillus sp. GYB004 TaxID=2994393 RepID=UPI002F960A23